MEKDKQAFFAQYFNQPVLRMPLDTTVYSTNATNLSYSEFINDGWLQLTPLSSLTDDHAIEVALMLNFGKQYPDQLRVTSRDNFCITLRDWCDDSIVLCDGLYHTFTERRGGKNEHETINYPIRVIDHFRGNGVLAKFRSYTTDQILSMGWAKLKQQ